MLVVCCCFSLMCVFSADPGDKVTAVTSVSRPSALLDGNFHYQFHAENTGGQVGLIFNITSSFSRTPILCLVYLLKNRMFLVLLNLRKLSKPCTGHNSLEFQIKLYFYNNRNVG